MLFPVNVNVPAPILVKLIEPEPFWITPLNVVDESSLPTVSALAPRLPVVTLPAPAREPIVSLKRRSRTAPADIVKALLL